jgi:hypothetical protein
MFIICSNKGDRPCILNFSSINPFLVVSRIVNGTRFSMWTSQADAETTASTGPADEPALVCAEEAFAQAFHYWRGVSSRRYLHSVYSLVGCPALPQANYILVRRHEDGTREALAFGDTKDDAISLNLAHLRHEGAKCGANEVHVHLLADTAHDRALVEADLTAAHARRHTAKAA